MHPQFTINGLEQSVLSVIEIQDGLVAYLMTFQYRACIAAGWERNSEKDHSNG
jgi:hypothetical protein